MTLRRIGADAEKIGSTSELRPCVAKLACLGGASGRMVLRIEIEDDLFAEVIAELKRLAFCEFGAHSDTGKIGAASPAVSVVVFISSVRWTAPDSR